MTEIHTLNSAPLDDRGIFYRAVVTQKTGRASHLIEDAHDSFLYPETDAELIASPVLGYHCNKAALALMAESRATVLLTGHGGDGVMGSTAHGPDADECRTVPRTTLLQALPSKRRQSALFDTTFRAADPFLDRRVL